MSGGQDDEDQAGNAAQAFKDLLAEVSVMRRAVEALPRALAENRPPAPPDYRSDIGKVAKELNALGGQLELIERHPALRLTPEQHRQAVAHAGNELMRDAAGKLTTATQDHERARGQLAGMIGHMRGQVEQREWVLFWVATVALGALLLGTIGSPFIASHLPFGWDGTVASIVMEQPDRWDSGWALLRAANPGHAKEVAVGYNLVKVNRAALIACLQEAIKDGKDQKCQIVVLAK